MSELFKVSKEEFAEILESNPNATRIKAATILSEKWGMRSFWDNPLAYVGTLDHETFSFCIMNDVHEGYWHGEYWLRLGADDSKPSTSFELHVECLRDAVKYGMTRRHGYITTPYPMAAKHGYQFNHICWAAIVPNPGKVSFIGDVPIYPEPADNQAFFDRCVESPEEALPPEAMIQKYLECDDFDNGNMSPEEVELYDTGVADLGRGWVRDTILKATR